MGLGDILNRIGSATSQAAGGISTTRGDPEPVGPYKKLLQNPFKTGDKRFPIDLSTNNYERLHYVTFFINVQEKSKYNVQEDIDPNAMSAANENRAADETLGIGQISSNTDTFSGVSGALGASLISAKFGAAAAGLGYAIGGRGTVKGVVTAGVAAAAGGAVGTAIVKSIDLTRKTKRLKSTISLYMPDTVQTTFTHGYNGISMTNALGLTGAVAQGASAVGTSISEVFKDAINSPNARPDMKGAGIGAMAEVGGALAEKSGMFGEGIKEAILFSAGLAQNPQVEILYQQTEHRNFTFTFKMIPRNAVEAQVIRDIIKEFKFYAAPELLPGAAGRFFIPPAEFDIKFYYNGKENDKINKISTCVLTRIDVNYASAGQWTTFDDGMPVETTMQLEFQELEIMHKQRIADGY